MDADAASLCHALAHHQFFLHHRDDCIRSTGWRTLLCAARRDSLRTGFGAALECLTATGRRLRAASARALFRCIQLNRTMTFHYFRGALSVVLVFGRNGDHAVSSVHRLRIVFVVLATIVSG